MISTVFCGLAFTHKTPTVKANHWFGLEKSVTLAFLSDLMPKGMFQAKARLFIRWLTLLIHLWVDYKAQSMPVQQKPCLVRFLISVLTPRRWKSERHQGEGFLSAGCTTDKTMFPWISHVATNPISNSVHFLFGSPSAFLYLSCHLPWEQGSNKFSTLTS